MPRKARKISSTGIYHIMLRGINKQKIFLDEQDYKKFVKEITKTKEKYKFNLYAYCLMPNHVHLQLKEDKWEINKIMHRIGTAYSEYFNLKYKRVGHVFQNRYLSKPVENDEYFLGLLKYIHQNPVKAHIGEIERYKWSSYNKYFEDQNIIDKNFALELFNKDIRKAIEKYIEFNKTKESYSEILEYEINYKLTDNEAKEIIKEKLNMEDIGEIIKYNKKYRNEIINKIIKMKIISKTQLARILNINLKMIQTIK